MLVERLEQALRRSALDRKTHALIFVDVDRFKSINDSLGHVTGDGFLTVIGARLKGVIRSRDLLARFLPGLPQAVPGARGEGGPHIRPGRGGKRGGLGDRPGRDRPGRRDGHRRVAEGVETESQVAGLKVLGCQIAQGFYFSQPLQASEFDELLIRHFAPVDCAVPAVAELAAAASPAWW